MAQITCKEWIKELDRTGDNALIFSRSLAVMQILGLTELDKPFSTYTANAPLNSEVEHVLIGSRNANRKLWFDIDLTFGVLNAITPHIDTWLYINAYKIKTLYETTVLVYNPIENYDRVEATTRETDTEFNGGARSNTKGAQSNSSSESTTHGEKSGSVAYGAQSNTRTYGEDSTKTEYGQVTGSESTARAVSAFTTETCKNAEETSRDTSTLQHSDTTTRQEREDGESLGAHTDSTTESAYTDSVTGTYSEGQRTDSATAYTDTTDATETITSRIHGNIGVTTTQQMLQSSRDIANFKFWEWLYTDLVNFLCEGVL